MKYPEKQFEKLTATLKILSLYVENLKEVDPNSLHFLVFQQYSEGHRYNSYVLIKDNIVPRHYAKTIGLNYTELFEADNSFELYPEGCHDSHIETAVKKALKIIES